MDIRAVGSHETYMILAHVALFVGDLQKWLIAMHTRIFSILWPVVQNGSHTCLEVHVNFQEYLSAYKSFRNWYWWGRPKAYIIATRFPDSTFSGPPVESAGPTCVHIAIARFTCNFARTHKMRNNAAILLQNRPFTNSLGLLDFYDSFRNPYFVLKVGMAIHLNV